MMLVEQGGGERMGEGGQSIEIEIEIEIEIDGEIGRWLKVFFWAVGEIRMLEQFDVYIACYPLPLQL